MRSNQDIFKGYGDCEDWRLGADQIQRTESVVVDQVFTKVYGVRERYFPKPVLPFILSIGPVLARQWYLEGLRTLDDVRNRNHGIMLSSHQEVCGCSHSVCVILTGAPSLKLDLKLEVAPTHGGIDILLMRPTGDGRGHASPSHSVPSKPRAKAIAVFLRHLPPRLHKEPQLRSVPRGTGQTDVNDEEGSILHQPRARIECEAAYGAGIGAIKPW